jgi:SAM-dependent methyltransferase
MTDADFAAAAALDAKLEAVCAAGWAFWEHFDLVVRGNDFHAFIPAEYEIVRDSLREHVAPGRRFLELGSGSGIITILADVIGFDAVGIELDPALVTTARGFAEQFGSRARFVQGSFLPAGFNWQPAGAARNREQTGDGRSGYLELGMALDDFDVVYGYPWHGEAPMMLELMRQYGSEDAILLLNDTNAGVRAYQRGKLMRP